MLKSFYLQLRKGLTKKRREQGQRAVKEHDSSKWMTDMNGRQTLINRQPSQSHLFCAAQMWCWKHKTASDFVSPLLRLLCGIYISLSDCVTQDLRCRLFCRLLYRKCIQVMPLDSPLGCAVTMTCWYESNTLSSWVQSVSFSRRRVMLPLLKSDLSLLSLSPFQTFLCVLSRSVGICSKLISFGQRLKKSVVFLNETRRAVASKPSQESVPVQILLPCSVSVFFIYSIGFGLCMNVDTRQLQTDPYCECCRIVKRMEYDSRSSDKRMLPPLNNLNVLYCKSTQGDG